ncbi:MAG: phosphotransferase [Pseudomonadota bacterium]
MNPIGNISENLRFLISEVSLQISYLQSYLKTPSLRIAKQILDRSGYTYNLKTRIQTECDQLRKNNKQARLFNEKLKVLEMVAVDIDLLTKLCRSSVEIVEQSREDGEPYRCLFCKKFHFMLAQVNLQIDKIEISIYENNTKQALKIGAIEKLFKKLNKKLQKELLKKLKHKKQARTFMRSLSLLNTLTQMGSALLSISETILSANLGQTISTERYYSLKNATEQWWGVALKDIEVKTIAQTRSGSAISGINTDKSNMSNEGSYDAIFKDGKKQKLKEEKQSVESWHNIFPGLAPKIINYKKQGDSAAILIEHLPGLTYEQILLHESKDLLEKAQIHLRKTLKKIWRQTSSPKKISAGYILQLKKRLNNVYALHPEFVQVESFICSYKIPDFQTLLKQAIIFEEKYAKAPFSVYIHGDFNVDNIIYDPLEEKINFIDLHRSQYMDYVQDISVFMVSHYRLQALAPSLRKRILKTSTEFYQFSHKFALKVNDETFNLRLALALARSFLTSTRFILDKTLSQNMYIRARYLIEQVLLTKPNKIKNFQLPINDIFTG